MFRSMAEIILQPMPVISLLDSFPESNYNSDVPNITSNRETGEALTLSNNVHITSIKFYLKKIGEPTGNCFAKIYNATGTVGINAVGTGDAIAVSGLIPESSVGTAYSLYEFKFKNPYLQAGDYVFTVTADEGDLSNYLVDGVYVTNQASAHAGNIVGKVSGTWSSVSTNENIFYLYGY